MNNIKKRSGLRLWLLAAGAILFGAAVGVFVGFSRDLPQIRALEAYRPAALTRILASDQSVLAELYRERRDPVALADIPDDLIAAVITAEDQSFYEHHGVKLKAIARAAWRNISAGRYVEGASTITQQLAKTLFLTPEKTLARKFREALLAVQLERRYTKQELLQLYLNQIYFGSGAYGVASAAKIFFGKSVDQLTLAECTLIAAMPRAPSRYSPLVNPELAVKRRNIVLSSMFKAGLISEADYEDARGEVLGASGRSAAQAVQAPYFISYIQQRLETQFGPHLLYGGGLTVFTTLRPGFQQAAQTALVSGLQEVEQRNRGEGLQGALICLDPASGAIWAMVGGRDYAQSSFNRAVSARRQPGSAFKPLVYGYAIQTGHRQNEMLLDAPVAYPGGRGGRPWQPKNFTNRYQGALTLRKALAKSVNIPAVKLLEQLGPENVVAFAHDLGIASELAPNLSLALGAGAVTLTELTAAYGAFANQGRHSRPFGVIKVVDSQGRTIFATQPNRNVVATAATAAVVTDMLQAVVNEGTGRKARRLGFAVAGKTGTSNDYKDAFFVGYSPQVLAGVWVGRDNARSIGKGESGGRAALPIWIDFMDEIHRQRRVGRFHRPDTVLAIPVNSKTGKVTRQSDPLAQMMLFAKDALPAEN